MKRPECNSEAAPVRYAPDDKCEQKTQRGWKQMLGFCFLASVICYVDRTNMSVAMVPVSKQYNWDKSTQGWIFAGFFIGYALTQIPGGILSGRLGGPQVVLAAVGLWSLFTLITPFCAHDLTLVMIARIGLGMGEGAAMPAFHNIASNWYPKENRALCVSIVAAAMQIGVVVSLLLSPVVAVSWELVFIGCGIAGFIWCFAFRMFPPENAFTPPPQLQGHSVPWRLLLSKKAFWAIYISHFGGNFGFYILISWLPEYFIFLGVPLDQVGKFAVPAYLSAACSAYAAGWLSDRLISKGWEVLTVRRSILAFALGGAATSLFAATLLSADQVTPFRMTVLFCFALTCHGCHSAGNMVNILDVAPRYAGETHGISNTFATLAGVIGNVYVGYILPTFGWSTVFLSAVVVYVISLMFFLCWSKAVDLTE